MPLTLTDDQKLVIPEKVIPPAEAGKLWIASVVLNVPKRGTWSAVTEGHPIDDAGNVYFVNPVTGKDATLRLESADLMADAAKSPALAAAINQVMAGIITAASEIKALRDAERNALEVSKNAEEVPGQS
jgi:hypothetical protein